MKHETIDREYFHLMAEEKKLKDGMKEVILAALKENGGRITFTPESDDDEYPVVATLWGTHDHPDIEITDVYVGKPEAISAAGADSSTGIKETGFEIYPEQYPEIMHFIGAVLEWKNTLDEKENPLEITVLFGSKQSLDCGNSVYTAYNLIKIFRDGFCILENPVTGKEEKRQLREINIEWLICVWDYYRDLSGVKEPEATKKKELYAFLYPLKHFERNASNHEILSGWMDGEVEKLTPDELAARINDESFDDANLWVRFMEVED
ncbi:MAG: hypothetical protein LBB85_09200 [Dysgonamonadaceae bacterium]|jgi:hypothetical protein|nr:hypothetical protein [Dysgonamonadaceae bacterium]